MVFNLFKPFLWSSLTIGEIFDTLALESFLRESIDETSLICASLGFYSLNLVLAYYLGDLS